MKIEPRTDVYARLTAKIGADLEQGVRPWLKPWGAEHTAGRISRPLRANEQPYRGVNVLLLWGEVRFVMTLSLQRGIVGSGKQ